VSCLLLKCGKDDAQLMSKHRRRSRSSAAGNDSATSAADVRTSLTQEQTGETASSSILTVGDSGKEVESCLEVSALAAGDAGSVNLLTVETQFTESPVGPASSGSTTDTASEVASLIHSPRESSSVSTVDSSFEGRVLKTADDDDPADDQAGPLDDSKTDLNDRLAAAAQVLACEDARSTVLNNSDSDLPTSINVVDGISLPDGNAADAEASQKLNGQKCPPRFSTRVSATVLY